MSSDIWKSMKCDCEWVWQTMNIEEKTFSCERCRLATKAYCEYLENSKIKWPAKDKIIPVTN